MATFWSSAKAMFTDVPLVKASPVDRTAFMGWENKTHSSWEEATSTEQYPKGSQMSLS